MPPWNHLLWNLSLQAFKMWLLHQTGWRWTSWQPIIWSHGTGVSQGTKTLCEIIVRLHVLREFEKLINFMVEHEQPPNSSVGKCQDSKLWKIYGPDKKYETRICKMEYPELGILNLAGEELWKSSWRSAGEANGGLHSCFSLGFDSAQMASNTEAVVFPASSALDAVVPLSLVLVPR